MRITGIRCYRQWQPFVRGTYTTSGGAADGFDSLVVAVDTDEGMTGWGELAPLGSFYDPAFSGGARAAVGIVTEALRGADPGLHRERTELLDRALRGHAYAKSAFDMACWDVAAKAAGRPLYEALGGRFGRSIDLYRSISPDSPEAMAAAARAYVDAGYRRLQVKVGQGARCSTPPRLRGRPREPPEDRRGALRRRQRRLSRLLRPTRAA